MGNRKDSALILALFLAGCGRCGKASQEATPDAVVISLASPEAAPPPVDLLWTTNAVVAVSSRVDNARDIPEHLVDRDEATAWNGKTGDLVGAWIAFRVPADSTVAHVMLSAGFDKASAKEDLFTANYRIAKVRISRDGKTIKDATLDTNQRLPQKIDVGAPGGEFKIEVLEVVAGAHTGWKEITVSEFGVFGVPGRTKPKPSPPLVRIGSIDSRASLPYDDVMGATYEAACDAFLKEDSAKVDEALKVMRGAPYDAEDRSPSQATCSKPDPAVPAKHGSILETAHVSISDEQKPISYENFLGEVLAFRTASGVRITNIRLSGGGAEYYSHYDYKLIVEKWVGDQLVIDVERKCGCGSDGYFPDGGDTWNDTMVMHTVCEGSTATCTTTESMK